MATCREFDITLTGANTEQWELRLNNDRDEDGNEVPHRPDTIGSDWKAKYMTVKGRMPIVVHGIEAPGSDVGYTLIVFEWYIARNSNRRRFREVVLEVSFAARGATRGGAEATAQRMRDKGTATATYWDPEVVSLAPLGTAWYERTQRQVAETVDWKFDLKAGYPPYVSAGPQWAWQRVEHLAQTDAIQVSGERVFAGGETRARPNAARWTLLENPSQTTGVPAYLRTAVLLKRRPKDDGRFVGVVSTEYNISKYQNAKKKLLMALGRLPRDEPILFDPKKATETSSWHAMAGEMKGVEALIQNEVNVVTLELVDNKPEGGVDEAGDGGDDEKDALDDEDDEEEDSEDEDDE